MPILDYRIDDRLIHGQVVSFWIPQYSINKILIIDDVIVKDQMRTSILKMACPGSCGLVIKNVEDAARLLKKYNGQSRLMIVVNNPKWFNKLAKQGIEIPFITAGNMSKTEGSEAIDHTVFVTEEDKQELIELAHRGTLIFAQNKPADTRKDITDRFK